MARPVPVSITLRIGIHCHSEASPRLRLRSSAAAVALGEPQIDLVLKVVDYPRPAAMIRRPDAVHAPLGKRRATDAKLLSGFYGSEPIVSI